MRYLLDTCVLYPTVMREVLLGVARAGVYTPLWSDRILEEWARAAKKLGPQGELQARSEIALLYAAWPKSTVTPNEGLEKRLWLPDPADVHVLAAAISGSADGIITVNAKDFPRQSLADEGLTRIDPDGFLLGIQKAQPVMVREVVENVRKEAERLSGQPWELRALMKKARLPRLGKAVSQ